MPHLSTLPSSLHVAANLLSDVKFVLTHGTGVKMDYHEAVRNAAKKEHYWRRGYLA